VRKYTLRQEWIEKVKGAAVQPDYDSLVHIGS
jgi:hypothetical protein